jgi:hypothetical protein
VVWEGRRREASPYPDLRRYPAVGAPIGEGLNLTLSSRLAMAAYHAREDSDRVGQG